MRNKVALISLVVILFTGTAYCAITDGILGYWNLDETSGSAIDSTGKTVSVVARTQTLTPAMLAAKVKFHTDELTKFQGWHSKSQAVITAAQAAAKTASTPATAPPAPTPVPSPMVPKPRPE